MRKVENVDRDKVLSIMDRIEFFEKFSSDEKDKIVDFHTNFFAYYKHELIIREGERNTAFYILLSGAVNVIKESRELPIARLMPGDFFGEISFVTGMPRTTSVKADELSILIKVDREMLEKLTAEVREKFKDKIIDKLIVRLKNMNAAFVSLTDMT